MKALAGVGFFVVQGAALAIGVVKAANGQGFAVLGVVLALSAVVFIKYGCIDNAPDAH